MKRNFLAPILLISAVLPITNLRGQVGNDNPTGPAGFFNGSVTTGCSYDPYTGNASRKITDIQVSGAVGTIPLAFSRIHNSRDASASSFGNAGHWRHSYNWSIPPSVESTDGPPPLPSTYAVTFPDGRTETFAYTASDPYYRAASGTRERWMPWDSFTGIAYLVLADGTRIRFAKFVNSYYTQVGDVKTYHWYWTFQAAQIIDPSGQSTSLTYNTDGTLSKITEHAGRWLQLGYTTIAGIKVISVVSASDGRIVQYSYVQSAFSPGTQSYVCLDHIVYFGDAQWTARYKYCAPNTGSANGVPMLWTCDDPMYAGPMKRIGYVYRTTNNADGSAPAYGQILSENYYDGTNVGPALTTLTVNGSTRTETRADSKTRTFTYTGYKLTSETDFRGMSASKTYDSNSYINSITDRNLHTTDLTLNSLTGVVLTATFPSTPGDTLPGTPRGVITYTYGWASCPDPNNRDPNNPYYPYSVTDEGGHATIYTRDTSKRITRIDYPDGGYETFSYNTFGQVLSHRLTAGGTETFTYDSLGNKQTYRDPYHPTGNPTLWYTVDSESELSQVTDALGSAAGDLAHTTSYDHNSRHQRTTTTYPTDPIDGQRHTVINAYNSDGTLASTTDRLGHVTSFAYDDYRRPLTRTTPQRASGDNTPRTTYLYYDANGTGNDYTHVDANVTHVTLPSGKKTSFVYDENYRRISATIGDGTAEAAKTSYGYDNADNLTSVVSPQEQPGQLYAGQSAAAAYDERDRIMSVTDPLGNSSSCSYDGAGRKISMARPNGQVTTFDSFDAMNRLLQQTIKQTPDPNAVTKYTYFNSGRLQTMQDPRLVANGSAYKYTYAYDSMGRNTSVTYPPDSASVQRTEQWHYDTAGRVDTFTNRNGKVQTATYDALNRLTGCSWNDGLTPSVTFGYDVGLRNISVVNANATISRSYLNDNLFSTETTTYADSTARTVTYSYDGDGSRASLQYPGSAYSFTYNYTARNQLWKIINSSGGGTIATYSYDLNGNLMSRALDNSSNTTVTLYDGLDRLKHITHSFVSDTRTLDYGYDSVSNLKWTKRDGGKGDVVGYDLADQSISMLRDIINPDTTQPGSQTINYDANGNRTVFSAYGPTDTYTTNDVNQYIARNSSSATYDNNGNMITGVDGSTYTYDALNRLISATKAGSTENFKYDGFNRQVSRAVGAGTPSYNVYDGWNLIAEYSPGGTTPATAYLFGAADLVKNLTTNNYYYQDRSGSTSHLADGTGHLKEWYRYDLHGTPIFYDATNNQISSSTYSIRHLFTGQQWYAELGLYDLRHRMYSSDIGRFLQPDPIGFNGDRTNLYRYCGNNPSKWSDPTGLFGGAVQEAEPVRVSGQDPNTPRAGRVWGAGLGGFGGGGGRGGGGGGGARAARVGKKNWIDDPTQSYDQMGQVGSDTVDNAVIYGAAVTPSPTAGNFSLSALGNLLGGGHSWDPLYNLLDRPATAEQKAWTDRGRVPTLIAASVLAAPLVAPAAFVEILALSPELVTAVYSTAVIGTSTLNPVAAEQVMNEPFEIWITEWIIQGGK